MFKKVRNANGSFRDMALHNMITFIKMEQHPLEQFQQLILEEK